VNLTRSETHPDGHPRSSNSLLGGAREGTFGSPPLSLLRLAARGSELSQSVIHCRGVGKRLGYIRV
jgi:hypothetical protein